MAEGTETEAQVDYLARLGCGFAQGYYFARPMDADQIDKLDQGAPNLMIS